MHELYELKEKLLRELEEYGSKEMSAGSLNTIDTLAHAIKNLCKVIEAMEEDGGSSRRSYRSSYTRERQGGSSRNSYARDRMGRYTREGGNRGSSREGSYTREDGIEDMVDNIRDMMQELPAEAQRDAQKFVQKLEQML